MRESVLSVYDSDAVSCKDLVQQGHSAELLASDSLVLKLCRVYGSNITLIPDPRHSAVIYDVFVINKKTVNDPKASFDLKIRYMHIIQ